MNRRKFFGLLSAAPLVPFAWLSTTKAYPYSPAPDVGAKAFEEAIKCKYVIPEDLAASIVRMLALAARNNFRVGDAITTRLRQMALIQGSQVGQTEVVIDAAQDIGLLERIEANARELQAEVIKQIEFVDASYGPNWDPRQKY